MRHAFLCLITYWLSHRLQFALSVLGVALGVAVVTAMDLANASALRSFRESLQTVAGRATHQIAPREGYFSSGVPDELFAKVARVPGVKAAAPVIEAHGLLLADPDAVTANTPREEREPERKDAQKPNAGNPQWTVVRILGIDPFLEEPFRPFERAQLHIGEDVFKDWLLKNDGVALPRVLAERLHLRVNDRVAIVYSGKRQVLRVIATYVAKDALARGSDDVVLMDIAAAQERFGQIGQISSIDLILEEGDKGARAEEELRRILPVTLALQRPSEKAGRTEALLEAFQLNLTALSLLALVVGIFLVHNTLTVAVLQRTPIIGTLRCLGVSRSETRCAVMLESLLLGVLGSLLGLAAGRALAQLFLERVGGTVSDLYVHISVFTLTDDPAALAKGMALGLIASQFGAFFPAREAALISPVQVLRRSQSEAHAQRTWKPLALAGALAFLVAGALAFVPGASPVPGLAAAFALACGGALCSPAATRAVSKFAARPLQKISGVLGMLAARGISSNLSRTGLAVGSLGMALSMTIGVGLMVASFRVTLERWMDQTLHADIYLRPAGPSLLRHRSFIPAETIDALRARPEVEALDSYRGRDIILPGGALALVVATDTRVTFAKGRSRFPFFEGDPDAAFAGLLRGEALVSESLARKQNLHVGDTIGFACGTPAILLRIAGIYYEYATDRGVVSLDLATYKKLFGDDRANSVSIYLKPGTDLDAVRENMRRDIGAPGGLYIFSNRSLREEAFRVFDRTFAITGQLENLSLAVGLCGILSALLALLRERATDFALLRAVGLGAKSLARLVVLEGVMLGLVAFGVACVLGPALALLLIKVINVRAFGWTIFFSLHAEIFVRVGILALLMSALAGIYPALRARRLNIASALREE